MELRDPNDEPIELKCDRGWSDEVMHKMQRIKFIATGKLNPTQKLITQLLGISRTFNAAIYEFIQDSGEVIDLDRPDET